MYLCFLPKLSGGLLMLSLGMAASLFLPPVKPLLAQPLSAPSTTPFPDTQTYWGQPFIQALAERDIITGYLDNTYRPEKAVARDEFAAILRQAFSQAAERQISRGSVYQDIPEGYWAAPAIEEAYEMGFMKGYPGGEFRPNQPVTKVEVLVSLAQNLNLPTATGNPSEAEVRSTAIAPVTPSQPSAPPRRARRPLLFAPAMVTLIQPLMAASAQAATAPSPSSTEAVQRADNSRSSQRPVSLIVEDYYDDAEQILSYAVDEVARATEAGIVVNHPNPRLLNPNQPITRGETAALIHQALVHQGKMSPLAADEPAQNYIVGR